ncbi:MAG: hypothetical protein N2323_07275 [candidate division WOR-3 bacterium]|nr:hypothetical protein [candidate division WOR-3 bacterium]MCX7837724.1 hypothetical protein [candidate division WOR-3 bacterium]MDW8114719.1 hypothetical protein [candidate division WOR-3 bacterium]
MKKVNKRLSFLKEIFWDYQWQSVLKNLTSPFVIARVLEIGTSRQVKELIKIIGEERIREFLKKYDKLLSKQSQNFWKLCYGIKEKKTSKKT